MMLRTSETDLDLKVCVQQGLEIKRSITVGGDNKRGVEAIAVERNAVDEGELVWPQSFGLFGDTLRGKAKVELHAEA